MAPVETHPAARASTRQPWLSVLSVPSILVVLAVCDLEGCTALNSNSLRHVSLRGLRGARSGKHLYCKESGGCSQCQENEEIDRYCADTGFKELLLCTTNEKRGADWPVVLTYPYPPDVHIDDSEGPDLDPAEAESKNDSGSGSDGRAKSRSGLIRVVRSCTESTVAAHAQALVADVAEAEARLGGSLGGQMGLFNFELLMVVLLGLALPVVYWRKIRIRHL